MTKDTDIICSNNDPEYQRKQLELLKQRVKEDDTIQTRTDDDFLLRFLRAKAFHVNSAFYMLKGYLNFNEKYTDSWLHLERAQVKTVLESGMIDIMPGCDSKGQRVFWFRFGKWNPRDFTQEAGLHVSALITQIAQLENIPMHSMLTIYDMKDTSFGHAKTVTPNFAKKMVLFLAYCMPIHIEQTHIVRESTIFSMLFSIFKTFLDDRMKKRIFIHGNNFESLYKHIEKSVLPKELGGDVEEIDPLRWERALENESTLKELTKAGYVFTN